MEKEIELALIDLKLEIIKVYKEKIIYSIQNDLKFSIKNYLEELKEVLLLLNSK